MKTARAKQLAQLRDETDEGLEARESALAHQLLALRLQAASGNLESPARVKSIRRQRARVLTLLRERELARL